MSKIVITIEDYRVNGVEQVKVISKKVENTPDEERDDPTLNTQAEQLTQILLDTVRYHPQGMAREGKDADPFTRDEVERAQAIYETSKRCA